MALSFPVILVEHYQIAQHMLYVCLCQFKATLMVFVLCIVALPLNIFKEIYLGLHQSGLSRLHLPLRGGFVWLGKLSLKTGNTVTIREEL